MLVAVWCGRVGEALLRALGCCTSQVLAFLLAWLFLSVQVWWKLLRALGLVLRAAIRVLSVWLGWGWWAWEGMGMGWLGIRVMGDSRQAWRSCSRQVIR